MFITINNLKIHYHTQGQGLPFLILHGWGRGMESWRQFLDMVKNKVETRHCMSLQIIVPDLPGFGKSSPPPDAWGVGDYAKFVWQFLEKLKIKEFYLLGHSFGGRIAIKMAAELSWPNVQKYPPFTKGRDRAGLKFASDQPLPPPAPPLPMGRENIFRINHLFLCAAAGIKHPPTLRQKMAMLAAKTGCFLHLAKGETQRGLILYLRKILYKFAGACDYNRARGIMREVLKKVIAEDLTPQLFKIKIPTIIILGDKDKFVPISDSQIMHKKIVGSRLIVLKGIGHNVQIEAGEELAGIIFNAR